MAGPHLAGRVEHPDLSPDASAGQNVGVLVVQSQGGPATPTVSQLKVPLKH